MKVADVGRWFLRRLLGFALVCSVLLVWFGLRRDGSPSKIPSQFPVTSSSSMAPAQSPSAATPSGELTTILPERRRLLGRCVRDRDGKALAGARVSVIHNGPAGPRLFEIQSGERGWFHFDLEGAGGVSLSAQHGRLRTVAPVFQPLSQNNPPPSILRLRDDSDLIALHFVDEDSGQAVGPGFLELGFEALLNVPASGRLELIRPEQPLDLVALVPGYALLPFQITPASPRDFTVALAAGGSCLGRVTDDSGIPLSAVTISFSAEGGEVSILSDEDGRYLFECCPLDKPMRITFARAGFETVSLSLPAPLLEERHDVILKRSSVGVTGAVSGLVVDMVDRPIAGVEVRLGDQMSHTNALGRFRLESRSLLPGTTFQLLAAKQGFAAVVRQVVVGSPDQPAFERIVLRPAEPVSGRVVDSDGRPIADARLLLYQKFRTLSRFVLQAANVSDENGFFQIDTPLEGGLLLVQAAGFGDGLVDPLPLDDTELLVTLHPVAALYGRVYAEFDGRPITQFTVTRKRDVGNDPRVSGPFEQRNFTDPAGRFVLDDLHPELSHSVRITAEGFEAYEVPKLSTGDKTIDFSLVRARGRLLVVPRGDVPSDGLVLLLLGTPFPLEADWNYVNQTGWRAHAEYDREGLLQPDGSWLFEDLPTPLSFTLFASGPNHSLQRWVLPRGLMQAGADEPTLYEIELSQPGTIEGSVNLEDWPEAGLVKLYSRENDLNLRMQPQDDGSFRFDLLPEANYRLVLADLGGRQLERRIVTLAEGAREFVLFSKDDHRKVEGRLLLGDQPLVGATVLLRGQGAAFWSQTDGEGRFVFEDVAPEYYNLSFFDRSLPAEGIVAGWQDPVDYMEWHGNSHSIRLSDEDVSRDFYYQPHADLYGRLDRVPEGGAVMLDNGAYARVADDGQFVFRQLPPGTYQLFDVNSRKPLLKQIVMPVGQDLVLEPILGEH